MPAKKRKPRKTRDKSNLDPTTLMQARNIAWHVRTNGKEGVRDDHLFFAMGVLETLTELELKA